MKLTWAIDETASIVAKHQRVLELSLHGTLLKLLGELLTYDAIERLLGHKIVKMRGLTGLSSSDPDIKRNGRLRKKRRRQITIENYEEETKLARSIFAAEAGVEFLLSLLRQMHSAVEASLATIGTHKGGRPTKHLDRQSMIVELAKHYGWFFDKRPTTTVRGQFYQFCREILEELKFDLRGLEKAIPAALKKV